MMVDEALKKRQRLDAATRKTAILRAAAKLVAERGYQRTTTKAIAREAGIAEGTIYKYFASKEELLFAFLKPLVVDPLSSLLEATAGHHDDRTLRALIANRVALFEQHRDLLKAVFSEALFNPALAKAMMQQLFHPGSQLVGEYFARRTREGAFRAIDPQVAIRALIGALVGNFLLWEILHAERPTPTQHQQLIDDLSTLFLRGLLQHPDVAGEEVP